MRNGVFDHRGMPKRRSEPPPPSLYIGQWLAALGLQARQVAKDAKMNEGYLSQLISGERTNPGGSVLFRVATAMGLKIHYLYEPPPPRELVRQAGRIDPGVLSRLWRKN